MKTTGNPSALHALSPEFQEEILDFLEGDAVRPPRSAAECAAWLAERGIATDADAIQQWRTRQLHRIRLEWCESMTAAAVEDARRPGHVCSDDELMNIGIRLFNALVVKACRNQTLSQNDSAEVRRQALRRLERELNSELEKFAAEQNGACGRDPVGPVAARAGEAANEPQKPGPTMDGTEPITTPQILVPDYGKPGKILFRYQKDWANDASRWKFGLMSRQVGKDFAAGFEGVRDCVEADLAGKRVTWLIAAPSERQSLESLNKWKTWAESFKIALDDAQIERVNGSESLLSSASITFPNGSRVIAVPGQPDTVRGFSANILLTEFAFFENPEATWRAILPSITNGKGGVKKVRLITTPNGLGNKAHDLWIKNYRPSTSGLSISPPPSHAERIAGIAPMWACHLVDIHTAVKQGLPADIEQLRAALDDPEGWSQEFECQFLDVQSVLLPYELIATCESAEATVAAPAGFWQSAAGAPLVMGVDFGRRRDLTVAWTLARIGDVWRTIEVLALDQTPTDQQVEILRPRIRRCGRVCVDYTGPGVGLGDYLVKEFHEFNPDKHAFGKIEPCTFSNNLKVEIFSKLRMAFERRELRVPVNCEIREDLHLLNRVSNPSGQITYRASHTADGHADRATALALALRATGGSAAQAGAECVPRPPNPRDLALASGNRSRWTL